MIISRSVSSNLDTPRNAGVDFRIGRLGLLRHARVLSCAIFVNSVRSAENRNVYNATPLMVVHPCTALLSAVEPKSSRAHHQQVCIQTTAKPVVIMLVELVRCDVAKVA